MSHDNRHLDSEALHAFLENTLPEGERAVVEHHLGECARCSSELEGWSLLFAELGELPELAPTPGFADRVMAELPRPRPFWVRAAGWLGARGSDAHLSPDRVQDYLDEVIRGKGLRDAETHLAACGECREVVEGWTPIFTSLGELPRLAPSPGFVDRVMAAFAAAPAPAHPARVPVLRHLVARAAGSARKLIPSTRKGWTVAGGIAAAPVAALLAVVGGVVLHPLLTFRDLGIYLFLRGSEWTQVGVGWITTQVVETPALYWLLTLLESAMAAPAVALGGLVALWGVTLASAWVLYRQVIAPMRMATHHVQAS